MLLPTRIEVQLATKAFYIKKWSGDVAVPGHKVLEDLVMQLLEKNGSEEYAGPKPAGYLEVEAQKILETTGASTSDK